MSLLKVTSFLMPELALAVDNTTRAAAPSANEIDSTLFIVSISCPTSCQLVEAQSVTHAQSQRQAGSLSNLAACRSFDRRACSEIAKSWQLVGLLPSRRTAL